LRRLSPALILVTVCVSACATDAQSFEADYRTAYCDAFDEVCTGSLGTETCEANGAPTTLVLTPLDPAGCTFHTLRAQTCLDVGHWTCVDDADGNHRILVPPDACADVWTCD
jgi:hypothetical protein